MNDDTTRNNVAVAAGTTSSNGGTSDGSNVDGNTQDDWLKDIEIANRAWTEDDVKSSVAAVAGRFPSNSSLPSVDNDDGANEEEENGKIMNYAASHPCPTLAVYKVYKGICKYWKKYQHRFKALWLGMDEKARRHVLQTIGPDMAKSRDDPSQDCAGQLILIPELVISELAEIPDAMIKLITDIVELDLSNHYLDDTFFIKNLIQGGYVVPDESRTGYINLLIGGDHPGASKRLT